MLHNAAMELITLISRKATQVNVYTSLYLLIFIFLLTIVGLGSPTHATNHPFVFHLNSSLTDDPLYSTIYMKDGIASMFSHAYDGYMKYAFPHDELKPISQTWTDSLFELGNSVKRDYHSYNGSALSLIESLSTLAILGNRTEFIRGVQYLADNLNLDVDVRVNVFEINIRLLGGLLSAHILASDPLSPVCIRTAASEFSFQSLKFPRSHSERQSTNFSQDEPQDIPFGNYVYQGELLTLAEDLGRRLLPAFTTPTGIPYAWVNLRHGMEANEITETCTAGAGTLVLEMGLLSALTKDNIYYDVADRAISELFNRRSSLDLMGNTIDVVNGNWLNSNSGIGAGVDSFFEYLFKAYIAFSNPKYLEMFHILYSSAIKNLKHGSWYIEANMHSAQPQHMQFQSFHTFWTGLQAIYGDLQLAEDTHQVFASLWQQYQSLPERWILSAHAVHDSEKYYPLRPELMESTYLLYYATKNTDYQAFGSFMFESLQKFMRVDSGYAGLRNVVSKELEDHMNSFFLSETCKYLYLLFDEDNWLNRYSTLRDLNFELLQDSRFDSDGYGVNVDVVDYIFTTEGHLFPLLKELRELQPSNRIRIDWKSSNRPLHNMSCNYEQFVAASGPSRVSSFENQYLQHMHDNYAVSPNNVNNEISPQDFSVKVGEGSFTIEKKKNGHERLTIRNLGTTSIEFVNELDGAINARVFTSAGLFGYAVYVGDTRMEAIGPFFGEAAAPGVPELILPPSNDQTNNNNNFLANLLQRIQDELKLRAFNPSVATDPSLLSNLNAQEGDPTSILENVDSSNLELSLDMNELLKNDELKNQLESSLAATSMSSSKPSMMHIEGQLVASLTPEGCIAPTDGTYENKIVVTKRGGCTFVQKVAMATVANASGLIVINYEYPQEDQAIFMMGHDPSLPASRLPVVMVRYKDANNILRHLRAGRQFSGSIHRFDLNSNDHNYNRHLLTSNDDTANNHLWVGGELPKMLIHALGGWGLEIAEANGTFQLKLFTPASKT